MKNMVNIFRILILFGIFENIFTMQRYISISESNNSYEREEFKKVLMQIDTYLKIIKSMKLKNMIPRCYVSSNEHIYSYDITQSEE